MHSRSLQMSCSGFAFESSVWSLSLSVISWDMLWLWDSKGGLGYCTDPTDGIAAWLLGVLC